MLFLMVILIHIFWKDISTLVRVTLNDVERAKLSYVLLALSLYIISVLISSVRWKVILDSLGYSIRAGSLVPVIFGSISVNNLTPANRMGGEPLRIVWAKEQFGVRLPHALVSILYERFVEVIPVAILSLYAFYIILPFFNGNFNPLKIIIYGIFTIIMTITAYYIIKTRFSSIIKRFSMYPEMLRKAFVPTLLFSSSVWILDIFRLKIVSLALGLHISMNIIIVLSVLSLFLGLLPLTPGGLGVVDGGLVSALVLFQIPLGEAIGMVAVERFISYGVSTFIGLLCLIYFGGLKIWRGTELHL